MDDAASNFELVRFACAQPTADRIAGAFSAAIDCWHLGVNDDGESVCWVGDYWGDNDLLAWVGDCGGVAIVQGHEIRDLAWIAAWACYLIDRARGVIWPHPDQHQRPACDGPGHGQPCPHDDQRHLARSLGHEEGLGLHACEGCRSEALLAWVEDHPCAGPGGGESCPHGEPGIAWELGPDRCPRCAAAATLRAIDLLYAAPQEWYKED
jgi:hypothetical protein